MQLSLVKYTMVLIALKGIFDELFLLTRCQLYLSPLSYLKGLVNLQKHFETLQDLNDIDEKNQNAENPILNYNQVKSYARFKIM